MSQAPKDEVCVSGSFCIFIYLFCLFIDKFSHWLETILGWLDSEPPDNCHAYFTPTCLFLSSVGAKSFSYFTSMANTSPTGASSLVLSLLSFTQWSNHVAVSVSSNPLPESMWSLSVSAVMGHEASEKLSDVSQTLEFLPANTKAECWLWRHSEGCYKLWLWRCFRNR